MGNKGLGGDSPLFRTEGKSLASVIILIYISYKPGPLGAGLEHTGAGTQLVQIGVVPLTSTE